MVVVSVTLTSSHIAQVLIRSPTVSLDETVEKTAGYLNDLWKFDSKKWTWVGGSNTANAGGTYPRNAGSTGTPGNRSALFTRIGAREGAAIWSDLKGGCYMFGGEGYGSSSSGIRTCKLVNVRISR